MDFSDGFKKIENSVVNILAIDAGNNVISSGTGVLINDGTMAITCAHCIVPNTNICARFSGQNSGSIGNLDFIDRTLDIAIIKFQNSLGRGVTLKNSSTVFIGQEAFVVGFPMNISYITALSANIAGFEYTDSFNYIRIDSSINHGNSGGPLFNKDGELIGIISMKHGSLSEFLEFVEKYESGCYISLGGLDPVQAIKQLIREMRRNLNLGIGYAIPVDAIHNKYSNLTNIVP